MILGMDIGNTTITFGLFKDDIRVDTWRLSSDQNRTVDEYGLQLFSFFQFKNWKVEQIRGIIISSVVPSLMNTMSRLCKDYFDLSPLVVGPGVKTGLNIRYENPKEVGADRIVNAVAALEKKAPPLIVVDFGTATTFCYIDKNSQYQGGVILPGLNLSTEALYEKAAKLPKIEWKQPARITAKSTVEAMQAGMYYGYASQVDGVIRKIKEEQRTPAYTIATGTTAEWLSRETKEIDEIDNYLTLSGLHSIYQKNTKE
ncbi:pantothenate kinase [Sinobaca qinghaiensis]|uniref:Type III pantothenate kinase n=1 Tax=Sinobaca qinghaiensis TaxID=342944 RepID=A0A419VUD2_9BACL|nr:type III pantothenate kinase [Sinobaca qinghaiensis]RKD84143.1 pantothenate kinase [Sinobaca qinghaiensis]